MVSKSYLKLFSLGLALLVASLYFWLSFSQLYKRSQEFSRAVTYPRVDDWLISAECARRTGSFLTVCPDKDDTPLIPIENRSLGDDRGHALVGNFLALVNNGLVTRETFVKVNVIFNAIGVLSLFLSLLWTIGYLPALVFAFIGTWLTVYPDVRWASPDVSGTQYGVLWFALASVIWFKRSLVDAREVRSKILGNAYFSLCLAVSVMFREPIGRAAEISIIGMTSLYILRRGLKKSGSGEKRIDYRAAVIAILAVLFSHTATQALFAVRNALFDVQPSGYVASHGIAHVLYMGLGAEENSFGIKYDDIDVWRQVVKISPGAKYLSPEHFRITWMLYFKNVLSSPGEVLSIYGKKMRKVGALSLFPGVFVWQAILILVLIYVVRWFQGVQFISFAPEVAVVALFYLQGVLALPTEYFLYAGKGGLFILLLLVMAPRDRAPNA